MMFPIFDSSAEVVPEETHIDMVYPIILDHDLPLAVVADIRESTSLLTRYPHHANQLRLKISRYLGIDHDQILLTHGANAALDLVSRILLHKKRVLVPLPAFWQLVEAPQRNGALVVQYSSLEPEDILEKAEDCEAIILCNPNNPLGIPFPEDFIFQVASASSDRLVIVDESYADMPGLTAISKSMPSNLLVIRSFKVFLIPGARVGYIVGNRDFIQRLAKETPPFSINVQGEIAAISVLENISSITSIWQQVSRDRAALVRDLELFGGKCFPSSSVFVCMQHPKANQIGHELMKKCVVTMFYDKAYIVGMPKDCIRFTVRADKIREEVMMRLRSLDL